MDEDVIIALIVLLILGLFFAGIIYLIIRAVRSGKRAPDATQYAVLSRLMIIEARLAALEAALASGAPARVPEPGAPPVTAEAWAGPPLPAPAVGPPMAPGPLPAALEVHTGPPPLAPPPLQPPVSMEKRIFSALIYIGVVLVFLSVAFIYWMVMVGLGEVGKIILGIITGLVFVAGGEFVERWQEKYRPLARAITGGGLAILYLSVFTAYSGFHLLDQVSAFTFMALVTAAGVALAVRYNSQAIIIMSLVGGFLTPPLMSTGNNEQVALMSYMIVLDLGLIGIAYWKQWRGISLLCYTATLLLFFGWASEYYRVSNLGATWIFATIFFLIFAANHVLYNLARRQKAQPEDLILITVNAGVYFFGMWGLLHDAHMDSSFMGLFALCLAAVFLLQARLALNYSRDDAYLQHFMIGLTVGFITFAVPLQLDYEIVTLTWAVEAVALTAYGLYSRNHFVRWAGLIVLAVALGHLAVDFEVYENRVGDYRSCLGHAAGCAEPNARFWLILDIVASYGSVMLALAALVYVFRRFQDRVAAKAEWFTAMYLGEVVLGLIFLLVMNIYLFQSDIYPHFIYSRRDDGMITNISLILSIYGSAAILAGLLYRLKWLRIFGLAALSVALAKVMFYDMAGLDMLYRIASFLVLGGLLIALSFLYTKYKDRLEGIALAESQATAPEAPGPESATEGPK
jgi:uncharacterized membrane protein